MIAALLLGGALALMGPAAAATGDEPFVVVLGIAQDGGVPQAGDSDHPGWRDPAAAATGDEPFVVVLGIAQDGGVPQAGDSDHPGWRDPAAAATGDEPFVVVLGIAQDGGVPQAGDSDHPGWRDPAAAATGDEPFVVVLGIAQDGGVPQAGDSDHPGWRDPAARFLPVSLGLVDPRSGLRWLFEATPAIGEQLHRLASVAPARGPAPGLAGIFVTHAHLGHYTGLAQLGHEAMGARRVAVYAMPRMHDYLSDNGPWDQLVRYGNVALNELRDDDAVVLTAGLTVTPLLVPHRQEYSEVVGYRIDGPARSVLFLPDIDSWEEWDEQGTRIEDVIATVDVAYLDATFFDGDELPGRDMSGFPHPFVSHSIARFAALPASERAKIRFIHLNHSNPALAPDSPARAQVIAAGMRIAAPLERVGLGVAQSSSP